MKLSDLVKNVLPKRSVLLVLLIVTAVAWASSGPPKPSAPASHAVPAQHAAPAQHSAPAQHNTAPAGRTPAGGAANRGPGAANTSKPGQTGAANRGPGSASGNNNRGGQTGANKTTQTGGNKTSQTGGNKSAQTGGNRTTQTGGNKSAQAGGNKTAQTGGNKTTQTANANRHQPAGSKTVAMKGGGSATYRANGQVRTIQAHGMTINHGMHGNTRIVSTRNGRTVVSNGHYGGYSQRAYYNHGGHSYYQRTYYRGGHYYAYGYRGYGWGGRSYYGYAPGYYYGPGYYGWAYNPWPAPVYWGVGAWGWGGAPWYGAYGPWFTPYPVYPMAAFWLTDYLIAANLQAAYAAQQEAAAGGDNGEVILPAIQNASADEIAALWSTDPLVAAKLQATYGAYMLGGGAPPAAGTSQLSPEVKQALADEMKNEVAAEKAAAAAGQNAPASSGDQVPPALDPKIRIFMVASDEDLTTSDGTECTLTAGDVIYRVGDKPDDDNMVDATVKSSKKDECAVGATVGVSADDIQEMHNQLRITMDAGLKELADKQGKNGMPPAPDTKTTAGEVPPPTPDQSVSSDLAQQQKDAAAAEADAKQ